MVSLGAFGAGAAGGAVVSVVIQAVDQFSGTMRSAEASMKKLGQGLTAFGAAGAAGIGLLVNKFSDVETGFAKVNTLLDEGQNAQELFKDTIEELNVTMGAQGDQLSALDGLYQTISAGISDTAEAQEFLKDATVAATGGSAQLSSVIEAGTKSIAAFGLEVSDSDRVFDVFAATVKAGQTTMEQLATAFPTVAGTAGATGATLEETAGVFAGLTKVMKGPEEAAVGLNAIFTGLNKPTEGLKAALAELGFESGQAAVEQLGLVNALQAIAGTTDGSATELTKLFGNVRALKALFPLLGSAADDVAASMDLINNSTGLAQKQFEDMENTTSQKVGKAMSDLNNTLVRLGGIFAETIAPIITNHIAPALERLFNWFKSLSPTTQKWIAMLSLGAVGLALILGPT